MMRLGQSRRIAASPKKTRQLSEVVPCDVAIFWLLDWRCRSSAAPFRMSVGPAFAQDRPVAFEAASVRAWARELAQKPYKAPDNKLPDALKDLTYDQYRMIRFAPDHALWRNEGLPFQLQFFHRGFYYTNRVDIFEVKDGRDPDRLFARHVHLRRPAGRTSKSGNLGFAGLPHPRADQPAGLFRRDRRVSRRELFPRRRQGPDYGLSARGLSLNTADPKGEEFPQLPGLLGRAAREGRKLDRGACAARQREPGCRLSLHHPARRDHGLRHRGDTVSARADRADRARAAHQHVLLRAERSRSASTISARRCTTPTGSRSRTGAASRSGARSAIRPTCRSAPSSTTIRAASA